MKFFHFTDEAIGDDTDKFFVDAIWMIFNNEINKENIRDKEKWKEIKAFIKTKDGELIIKGCNFTLFSKEEVKEIINFINTDN